MMDKQEKDKLSDILRSLNKIYKTIPYFIDTRDSNHKKCFDEMQNCIMILRECLRPCILPQDDIDSLSVYYYVHLINIYTIGDKELYKRSYDFLAGLYDALYNDLEDDELYECLDNLHKLVIPSFKIN